MSSSISLACRFTSPTLKTLVTALKTVFPAFAAAVLASLMWISVFMLLSFFRAVLSSSCIWLTCRVPVEYSRLSCSMSF